MKLKEMNYEDFPHRTYDKLRYRDTDAVGHVNNAVFATALETGRTEIMIVDNDGLIEKGFNFVVVKNDLNFISEITWPGTIEIGSALVKVGNSSMSFYQRLFQKGKLVADAHTTIVQIDEATRKSSPFSDNVKAILMKYFITQD